MQINTILGEHQENTLEQFKDCMVNADRGALCADGHLGYVMPIGGVAAYSEKISPMGVGFDIACGNMAVQLDLKIEDLELSPTLDFIEKNISFGVGRTNQSGPQDHPLFDYAIWESYPGKVLREKLKQIARTQLGTVGSGNHYVDIFKDLADNSIWIGVHFGSRGFGHKTATGFLNLAINGDWESRAKEQEVLLNPANGLGADYYNAMELCGQYAYAGREWVVKTIVNFLGVEVLQKVHNHHNFAWKETHFGQTYYVVRKGSTPVFPGQKGFIGGSMGDNAVIVEGVDSELSRQMLYSTVHGAGRVMGRIQAAGKRKRKKDENGNWSWVQKSEGKISWEMQRDWLKKEEVTLRGGGRDEAPQAYRRLPSVLEYHKDTIKILHNLKPLGVVMAGENEFDPYKD